MGNSRISGDFLSLLSLHSLPAFPGHPADGAPSMTEGTTVFAFQFQGGVLVAGDRRATAGNLIVTDSVEKVIEIDASSILAIAGSPAIALEMARVLQTSFEYYRRSQLQPLSLSAKVRALARLLRENLPMAMQGVGVVMPLFAAMDPKLPDETPKIFFYDPLGAQFQAVAFAASGSGSGTIRSVMEFLSRFAEPKPVEMSRSDALQLALRLLEIAASQDSATGGVDPAARRFATVRFLTARGIETADAEEQELAWKAGGVVRIGGTHTR